MKQHSKNLKLELGEHLKFNVEISKEKVLLHSSFSLFNIGTQKNISCALCIVRQNTSSVFNFNNYITTSLGV